MPATPRARKPDSSRAASSSAASPLTRPAAAPAAPAKPPAPRAAEASAKAAGAAKPGRGRKSAGAAARKVAMPQGKAAATSKASPRAPAAPRPARLKLVRDSFTMPKPDFERIDALKRRALKLGHEVKKSELLRAGLHVLTGLDDGALIAAVQAVPRLKTGRPHKKGK